MSSSSSPSPSSSLTSSLREQGNDRERELQRPCTFCNVWFIVIRIQSNLTVGGKSFGQQPTPFTFVSLCIHNCGCRHLYKLSCRFLLGFNDQISFINSVMHSAIYSFQNGARSKAPHRIGQIRRRLRVSIRKRVARDSDESATLSPIVAGKRVVTRRNLKQTVKQTVYPRATLFHPLRGATQIASDFVRAAAKSGSFQGSNPYPKWPLRKPKATLNSRSMSIHLLASPLERIAISHFFIRIGRYIRGRHRVVSWPI